MARLPVTGAPLAATARRAPRHREVCGGAPKDLRAASGRHSLRHREGCRPGPALLHPTPPFLHPGPARLPLPVRMAVMPGTQRCGTPGARPTKALRALERQDMPFCGPLIAPPPVRR